MKITRIILENFRGFKYLQMGVDPKLNVIIGNNGAGKTSILDAIALQLNHYIGKLKYGTEKYQIEIGYKNDDINFFATNSSINIDFNFNKIVLPFKLIKESLTNSFSYNGDEFNKYIEIFKTKINSETNFPILVYFNQQKDLKDLSVDISENYLNSSNKHVHQLDAYLNSCNSKPTSFRDFTIWWRMEEDKENEIRLQKNPNYRHKELETVRIAQKKFLGILKSETYENLRVFRTNPEGNQQFYIPKEGCLIFKIKNSNNFIKLDQLSEGEKLVFLMVSDISRRLVIANPSLKDVLKDGKGIVLIDEIEQHLHPAWQRTIVSALTKTFPSLQFIVTTHSPQVLSMVKSENIFLLDNFDIYTVSETFGRDSNEILDLVFNVPESPFYNDIKLIYKDLSLNKLKNAELKRKKVVKKIGDNYSEIKKIDHIFERMTER